MLFTSHELYFGRIQFVRIITWRLLLLLAVGFATQRVVALFACHSSVPYAFWEQTNHHLFDEHVVLVFYCLGHLQQPCYVREPRCSFETGPWGIGFAQQLLKSEIKTLKSFVFLLQTAALIAKCLVFPASSNPPSNEPEPSESSESANVACRAWKMIWFCLIIEALRGFGRNMTYISFARASRFR